MYFKAQPFLKIFFFLALGIVLSNYFTCYNYLLISIIVFLGIILFFVNKSNLALYIFIFSLGFGLVKLKQNHFNNHLPNNISAYQAIIIEDVQNKVSYQKTVAKVLKYKINNQWFNNNYDSKVILTTNYSHILFYGKTILVKGSPTEILKPQNPFQFDYKTYMQRQGVYYQHFVFDNNIFIYNTRNKDVFYYAYLTRHFLESKINYYVNDIKATSILNAMVLGIRTQLDDELFTSYSNSGIIHVIAISGLHIALFFTFLSKLFFWVPQFRRNQIIIAIVSVLLMWSYTFIAGFGASVVRATIMFSFILYGNLRKKGTQQTDIFNLLFACASFMIIYDPDNIWDIGFQLSFVAVLGILFFKDYFQNSYEPKYLLIKWIWDIVSVTLAAQLATIPLTLLYFNKLTFNFLLANLIVIPVSSFLLYVSIAFFIMLPFEFIAQKIAFFMKDLTNFMNYTAKLNASVPFGIFENIHFNIYQTLLAYIVLLLIVYNIHTKTNYIKWITISLVLSIAIIQYYVGYKRLNSTEHYILFHYKSPIFYSRNGNTEIICTTKKLTSNPKVIDFTLQKFRANNFITKSTINTIENHTNNPKYSIFVINGKRIIYLLKSVDKHELTNLKADYIFVPDYLNRNLVDYLNIENATIVVNTIDNKLINKKLHSLAMQGALQI